MSQQQINRSYGVGEYKERTGEDVDLLGLFVVLWRGWPLIVCCVVMAFSVAFLYVIGQPVVYRIDSKLSKPHAMDLAFNQLEILTLEPGDGAAVQSIKALYTPQEVFEQSLQALKSRTYQKEFLLEFNGLEGREPVDFQWFSSSLSVLHDNREDSGVLTISMMCADVDLCLLLVDSYVEFVRKKGRHGVVEEMLALLDSESHKATQKADYLKEVHRQDVRDRMEKLDSYITVARGLGWGEPNGEILASDKMVSRYYEGYRLLELERDGLVAVLDNEAFVSGLREQQRKLARIEFEKQWVSSYGDDISVLNVVDLAYSSMRPVAPKTRLIVVLSLLLGIMFGVFLVFIREGVRSHKARQS